MLSIKEIKKPISNEMNVFEDKFKSSLKTRVPLLDKIMHYIIKRKGKQMRPMFVFLCAKIFNNTKESTYTAASLIELLHTATLVHDDVIDEANFRRGVFSINALWKNKVSVQNFPTNKEFTKILKDTGFSSCNYYPLTLGVVSLYIAIK